jgi:4'-phosphopantetheinyl transferase
MYAHASGLLSPPELERASRFLREADRRAFLAGRFLARVALGTLLSEPPRHIEFVLGAHGKPAIRRPPREEPIYFNLSHTRGLVTCAVTRVGDVGVDVEALRVPPADVAERFFAPPEIELLRVTPAEEQSAAFYAIWTLKESFVKARGDGLSVSLDSFAVRCQPPGLLRYGALGEDTERWHFTCVSPTPAHHLALCVRAVPAGPPIVATRWLRA